MMRLRLSILATLLAAAICGQAEPQEGYHITEDCDGCGLCLSQCPQNCIDSSRTPFKIQAEHCLHCGNCVEICPQKAARGGSK